MVVWPVSGLLGGASGANGYTVGGGVAWIGSECLAGRPNGVRCEGLRIGFGCIAGSIMTLRVDARARFISLAMTSCLASHTPYLNVPYSDCVQFFSSMGVITETCEVVLTPIVVNGEPAFEEVRSCVITMDTSNNGGAGGGAAGEDQTPPPPAESSGGEAPPPAESPGAEVPPPAESSGAEVPPPAESSGAEAPPAASSGSPLETFVS